MTEAEWLAGSDPRPMLEYLRERGQLSERKARLFAVATARAVWPWMPDARSREAVEVGERYADGLVGQKALRAVRREAFAAGRASPPRSSAYTAAVVALDVCLNTRRHDRLQLVVATAGCARSLIFTVLGDAAGWAAGKAQCDLLRDAFGNPFRPVAVPRPWLTPAVVSLAQAAYDNRELPAGTLENARLAILADALEEAGCDSADVLVQCRSPGPHVRGCWVVDLVLGKE